MSYAVRRARIIMVIGAVGLIGCDGAEPSPQVVERPLATPSEAVSRLVGGLVAGDASVLDVVRGDADVHRALESNIGFAKEAAAFRDAFVAAYGHEAWVTFQDENHSPGEGNARFNLPDANAGHPAQINENGDEAFVNVPSLDQQIRLIRVDKGWLVDGQRIFPDGTDPKKAGELLQNLATAVKKYRNVIGKPGITPDDIDSELGRAMMAEFGMTIDKPHRFDVDAMQ